MFGLSAPKGVAQPAFSTMPLREYGPAAFNSTSTAAPKGSDLDFSMQYGVRAVAIPDDVSVAEFFLAVPPVTQPPQVKPTMAIAIAPTTTPLKAGFVQVGISNV